MKKTFIFLFTCLSLAAQSQTISEIQGGASASPYLGQTITTSGIVTGVHSAGYFLQDGPGEWNGVYVYQPGHTAAVGQELEITGVVEEYFDLTEIKDISASQILSDGNELPEPVILSTDEVNDEAYEGVLVRIEEATCTNADLGFGEYEMNDGSGSCMGDDLCFPHSLETGIVYNLTGPLYYSFSNFKICPRSSEDIEIALPLYFTIVPEEFDLGTTSLTIRWSTNAPADANIQYGTDPANLELSASDSNELTDHELILNDLSPGTVYYMEVQSSNTEAETPVYSLICATASESSGEINVYFNHSVDESVATVEPAVWTLAIADTIKEYLLRAESTLDIAMYDLIDTDASIFTTINQLHNAGVRVRYITDDEPPNEVLDNVLDAGIPVLRGNAGGLMHNKFILIDAESVDNAWVISGSTNHTGANLGWDFNNMICIQDQSLAKCFTLEFEEMWGGSGDEPDEQNSKFGAQKSDNTPHKFLIAGIEAECYFSPTDGTTSKILRSIEEAEHEIAFATMVFTENSLGTAMANAHNNGLDVEGIIDYVEFNGSEFDYLLGQGVDVIDYQNEDGTQWPDGPVLHHKYMIADYMPDRENPLLLTGSHNWSASAESIHDENILIFRDHRLANLYYQEYRARRLGMGDEVSVDEIKSSDLVLYPNPNNGEFVLDTAQGGILFVRNAQGRLVRKLDLRNGVQQIDLRGITEGIYLIELQSENGEIRITKVVIAGN